MSKKVLIIGASGFLGTELFNHLIKNDSLDIIGTFFGHKKSQYMYVDILCLSSLKSTLQNIKPDIVLFLAGTKDVSRCELDPEYAIDLNVQSVRNFINVCQNLKINPYTLFFSTDYVYDGTQGYYTSDSVANPNTVYGVTNLLAEKLLFNSGLSGTILRVSAVMGKTHGFYKWLESRLDRNESIDLFNNTYFSPTSIGNLCRFIEKIVCGDLSKKNCMVIKNFSDGYRMTRYQFGKTIAQKKGIPIDLIYPVNANIESTTFQVDLSIIPDGQSDFFNNDLWDNLDDIY